MYQWTMKLWTLSSLVWCLRLSVLLAGLYVIRLLLPRDATSGFTTSLKKWASGWAATIFKSGTHGPQSEKLAPKSGSDRSHTPNDPHGWSTYGPVLFAFGCVVVLSLGASRIPKAMIVPPQHHVAILAKLSDGDFAYRSDEEPNGSTYRVCPEDKHNGVDTERMLTQAVGYVADYAIWQEEGSCRSIYRDDLGFWFRDENTKWQYLRVPKGASR
jgi:hypothetical protein